MKEKRQILMATALVKMLEEAIAAHGDKQIIYFDADTDWLMDAEFHACCGQVVNGAKCGPITVPDFCFIISGSGYGALVNEENPNSLEYL